MTRIVISLVLVLSGGVWGQELEVASIRPHLTEVRRVGSSISGPRLNVEAFSLVNLVEYAFDLKMYQVSGGPGWAQSDRFDIAAKAEGDAALTQDQARHLVQQLLADRFGLKFHREAKEMPVYALVIVRSGPKLKESPPDAQYSMRVGGKKQITEMTVTKGSMAQLATQLSNNGGVDRPVLDMTGLTGTYDYNLEWAPEYGAVRSETDAPSIFTAIQEQLGLKLESSKAPVEVLIIEHADNPSGN